jgi:hypothetical protein
MINLKDKIIIVEGLDCAGKTELAKWLAWYFEMSYVDTDWRKEVCNDYKGQDWPLFVDGLNLMLSQFMRSCHGFVKVRYSLSEYVFRQAFHRQGKLSIEEMNEGLHNKVILVLVDLPFEKYQHLAKTFRAHESSFTQISFDRQRELFLRGFELQPFKTKFIVHNEDDFSSLLHGTVEKIEMLTMRKTSKRRNLGMISAAERDNLL